MNNNYSLRLTIFTIAVLASSPSFGNVPCRIVDFAELQSFNKNELATLYCVNNITIEYSEKAGTTAMSRAIEMAGQGRNVESRTSEKDAKTHRDNASACRVEQQRIDRALRSTNTKVESCNPRTLANIQEPPALPVKPKDPLIIEYCKANSDIKQQLDLGNSFVKETARLNTVKEKMRKNKIPLPTDCK